MESLYETYAHYKGWMQDPDDTDDEYFEAEMGKLHLRAGARVAEVGFGEGRFLDYAKRAGLDVVGFEIIESLVAAANDRGHSTTIDPLSAVQDGDFDAIVAFDFLEHLEITDARAFLLTAKSKLKQDGKLLLRFPNGASPFSLAHQNGDLTHRSFLSAGSLSQLAFDCGLDVVQVSNASRVFPKALPSRLRRRVTYFLRNVIEYVIGFAYYGGRAALDPNLTVVLTGKRIRANRLAQPEFS